jgi:branched-chain amino acid transport system permease protein
MGFFAQQTFNGLVVGLVFSLFALGFALVLANLRIFNVAHEGVFVWGAIAAYFFSGVLHWPFVLAAVAAAISAALVNCLIYLLAIRHLLGRHDREMAGFVSSLGALIVLTQLADIALNQNSVRLPFNAFPIAVWHVGSLEISSIQLAMALAAIVVFVALWWLLEHSGVGRDIKAVTYDRELASIYGVNVERTTLTVFALSGLLAGIAAVLFSVAYIVISADIGDSYGLTAIAITVVGGFGSPVGTIVAGVGIGLVSSWTTAYVTTSYSEVVVFALMLAVLVVFPNGLVKTSEAAASRS